MVVRFTDNILNNIEQGGFITRQRIPKSLQIAAFFVVAFILIALASYFSNGRQENLIFFLFLFFIIAGLGVANYSFITIARRHINIAEFQNAIFASAVQIDTNFCMVMYKDGSIVYINQGFQDMFPAFMQTDSRTVYGLFKAENFPSHIQTQILHALEKNIHTELLLPLSDIHGNIVNIAVKIDAINRPFGYFIMRGKQNAFSHAHQ